LRRNGVFERLRGDILRLRAVRVTTAGRLHVHWRQSIFFAAHCAATLHGRLFVGFTGRLFFALEHIAEHGERRSFLFRQIFHNGARQGLRLRWSQIVRQLNIVGSQEHLLNLVMEFSARFASLQVGGEHTLVLSLQIHVESLLN
jgi:hypothetical protein